MSDLHKGSESLILFLPALYKLQSEGLVTAEGSHCTFDLLFFCSAELQAGNAVYSSVLNKLLLQVGEDECEFSHPGQQIVSYEVHDRRLVLLPDGCHLLRDGH